MVGGMFVGGASVVGLMAILISSADSPPAPLASLAALMATATPTLPTSTPTAASPSPSPSATATATASSTPSPTATLTQPQQMIRQGELSIIGPLASEEHIVRLFEAAIRFIAPSATESRALGEMINGTGYGSPTLICGPLSVAILRDAGLIAEGVTPHDFWLLNPKVAADRATLERVFPAERFQHLVDKSPLHRIDWTATPLLPGDFLYLEEGTGGNFDHMLVVSRIDSGNRAFAVTNYNTPGGFIVDEALLYDPNDPSAGLFAQWTRQPNAELGSTGFGGFELWRLRSQ